MNEQDEQWFDALAGHSSPANAQDQRLQQALRQAARIDAAAQPDQLAERRLLDRLEREGLLSVAGEPQQAKRWLWPRLAQVAVIVLCLGLLVELSLMPTLKREEERKSFGLKDAPDRAAPAAMVAPKAEAEAESLGFSKSPQELKQAHGSAAKPALAELPSVELSDQAASAVPHLGNSALRSAKSPLLKRERQQAVELWVEDMVQASEQLQAWRLQAETDFIEESAVVDDGLMQLRCERETVCKELEDVLLALSMRPWLIKPSVGQVMLLRLKQAP